jgi:hypothetical protein
LVDETIAGAWFSGVRTKKQNSTTETRRLRGEAFEESNGKSKSKSHGAKTENTKIIAPEFRLNANLKLIKQADENYRKDPNY